MRDAIFNRFAPFGPDEPMQTVAGAKIRTRSFAVLGNAPSQISRDPDIDRAPITVCHDIDPSATSLSIHRQMVKKSGTPGQARGDESWLKSPLDGEEGMSKINHTRPELIYRDNLRRELSRIAEMWTDKSDPVDAPAIFKPFAETPSTLHALGKLLEAFNKYLEDPGTTFSLTPPEDAMELRNACREFGRARMNNPYDRLYSVHDWLRDTVANRAATNAVYEWLLRIVEAS